jgi:hypothetical protein
MKRRFTVSKCHAKIFSASWSSKKRFGRSRLSYVLSRRMILSTHNLSSERLKNDFGEVDEEIFQGVELPCEFMFCISGFLKSDFDEVS